MADLLSKMRERLDHFLGRNLDDDEGRLRSEAADRDFQDALRVAREARKGFDSRRPPAVRESSPPSRSLESLDAQLQEQSRLMREALTDDDGDP